MDSVLETELPTELVAAARRVLLALVESDRTRAVRTDGELAERLPEVTRLEPVLEALRQRGIIVPLRAANGQPAWELVHDSLVPRVLAWSDRQDLARQRALEIVRHHLRGSRQREPSLLTASELREVNGHKQAIEELDREWAKRGSVAWTPIKLVARSRQVRRNRWMAFVTSVVAAMSVAGFLGLRWFDEREQRRQQELLSRADVGTFVLELSAFDWAPSTRTPISVSISQIAGLDWRLYEPSSNDDLSPSATAIRFTRREATTNDPRVRNWRVEARGGKAILSVSRSGCAPSLIPLVRLPGYVQRDGVPRLKVAVPTCAATKRGMIEIESGPYISGGLGEPSVVAIEGISLEEITAERTIDLPAFAIDRTEVSNAAYQMFTSPTYSTAIPARAYPNTRPMVHAGEPATPQHK